MSKALIIPSIYAQARPKWNERYEIIVRLDATAKEKESSLITESSDSSAIAVHSLRIWGETASRLQNSLCFRD
jgi:hypothetical protein